MALMVLKLPKKFYRKFKPCCRRGLIKAEIAVLKFHL